MFETCPVILCSAIGEGAGGIGGGAGMVDITGGAWGGKYREPVEKDSS